MNIALINGPAAGNAPFMREGRCTQRASIWTTQWPPITLAYLAAMALEIGHTPRIFDCPAAIISMHRLLGSLHEFNPDLCVLAISTPSVADDMATAQSIAEALPETRVAVCGVHASVLDRELLQENPWIDFIMRSEPEKTFSELLMVLESNAEFEKVEGLSFQGPDGPTRNPNRPFIENLDRLPFPAWDHADLNLYRLPFRKQRQLCIAPHRGCPYHCSFCTAGAYYGHTVRFRGIGPILEEIRHNRRFFGINDFFMWADTFTIKKSFVMNLAEALRVEAPGIRWACNSRTDTVDGQMLFAMRESGCWMISFGIESTDAAVLSKMSKKPGLKDFNATIQTARKVGMKTLGHFIFGLPGETAESMRRTLEDALASDLDFAQFYTAAPFVGSPLYDEAVKRNYLRDKSFADIAQTGASMSIPGLAPPVVDNARFWATKRFYLDPIQIYRVLSLAGFGIFRQLVRVLRRYWKTALIR